MTLRLTEIDWSVIASVRADLKRPPVLGFQELASDLSALRHAIRRWRESLSLTLHNTL
jgi:hypothetical protein